MYKGLFLQEGKKLCEDIAGHKWSIPVILEPIGKC